MGTEQWGARLTPLPPGTCWTLKCMVVHEDKPTNRVFTGSRCSLKVDHPQDICCQSPFATRAKQWHVLIQPLHARFVCMFACLHVCMLHGFSGQAIVLSRTSRVGRERMKIKHPPPLLTKKQISGNKLLEQDDLGRQGCAHSPMRASIPPFHADVAYPDDKGANPWYDNPESRLPIPSLLAMIHDLMLLSCRPIVARGDRGERR